MEKHSFPCGYVFRGEYRLRLFLAFVFIISLLLIVNLVHFGDRSMWCEGFSKSVAAAKTSTLNKMSANSSIAETLTSGTKMAKSHDTKILPTKEKMASMSQTELIEIYENFMNTVTFHCKTIIRAGTVKDGGWNVCVDPEYIPKKPCLVYSFGVGWDSSFDLKVHKKFNCEVHSFDPTLNKDQVKRISPLLHFHPIGLSDRNNKMANRDYKTLYEIRRMLGHLKTELAILKVDIELWEWPALRHSITNHMLDDVRQLYVEFHIKKNWGWKEYHSSLVLLRDLEDLGFRAFSVLTNEAARFVTKDDIMRALCANIYYVKIK